jgi:hypothetical protein
MGIPNKARGMRLSDEEVRWLDEIMDVMNPMLPSRTATVGWNAGIVHTILTVPSILRAVEAAFQDARRSLFVRHMCDTSSPVGEMAKPGPVRLRPSKPDGARVTSSQFTGYAGRALHQVCPLKSHPSLGAIRLIRRVA